MESYEVVIIGAGSAGMSAGIYAQRFGLSTLIIGKVVGGLLNDSHKVENYPGFTAIPGFDLMMKFKEHVDSLAIPVKEEWVTKVEKKEGNDAGFIITTDKQEYFGKTLIITTGTKHRHLGLEGEEELAGKGVSYCATCDAAFTKGQDVIIVGGGDSAAQAGALVAQHAKKVYVAVRGEKMRAEPINIKRLEDNPKVEIIYTSSVTELKSDASGLTGVVLNNGREIVLQSLFVEIGADVQSELAIQLGAAVNERKEIIIDEHSQTNIKGLYAAGDCGNKKFKQAITGASEGVIAAFSAYEYLKMLESGEKVDIGY